jgi:hypothetical protein
MLGLAVAGLVATWAAPAAAQSPTEELWRAYPLEQTATTTDSSSAPRTRTAEPTPSGGEAPAWPLLLAVAAAGVALVIAVAGGRRRRRAGPAVPETFFAEHAPAPAPAAPRRARTRGPVCQVRWLTARGSSRFGAVLVGEDGSEQRLAESPPVDVPGAAPPLEPNPVAQRALRQLSKNLRDSGWRPLRAKGRDQGETRWYARRFTQDVPGERERPSAGVAA